eukprot:m.267144 g.267144  ORF g.267144 m.267144 type:complete len:60 (-) comp19725_c0_seq3:431-610(-)
MCNSAMACCLCYNARCEVERLWTTVCLFCTIDRLAHRNGAEVIHNKDPTSEATLAMYPS